MPGNPKADFKISVTPISASVIAGQSARFTITVSPIRNFSGTVRFSSSLPVTFNPVAITRSGTSTVTVATPQTFPAGSITLIFTGTSGSIMHNTQTVLTVWPYIPPVETPLVVCETPMRKRGQQYQRRGFSFNVIAHEEIIPK